MLSANIRMRTRYNTWLALFIQLQGDKWLPLGTSEVVGRISKVSEVIVSVESFSELV